MVKSMSAPATTAYLEMNLDHFSRAYSGIRVRSGTTGKLRSRMLPPELIAIIMSCLHEISWSDKSTFASCSLVSRSWTEEARRYLFASIRVDSESDFYDLFYQANSSPAIHLRRLVREFYVFEYVKWTQDSWAHVIFERLPSIFPSLTTINFQTNYPRVDTSRPDLDTLLSKSRGFSNVDVLSLSRWRTKSVASFRKTLNLFPSLTELRCTGVQWDTTVPIIPPNSKAQCRLHKMSLMSMSADMLASFVWLWCAPEIIESQFYDVPFLSISSADLLRRLIIQTIGSPRHIIRAPVIFSRKHASASNSWVFEFGRNRPAMRDMCLSLEHSHVGFLGGASKPTFARFSEAHIWVKLENVHQYDWPSIDNALAEFRTFKVVRITFMDEAGSSLLPPAGCKTWIGMPRMNDKIRFTTDT